MEVQYKVGPEGIFKKISEGKGKMRQEQPKSWLDLREEECKEGEKREKQLLKALADLDKRIKGTQDEQKYWDRYVSWVKQNREKMEDADRTLYMCDLIKVEAVENEKELTETLNKTRFELDRIRCLGSFVQWVSSRV